MLVTLSNRTARLAAVQASSVWLDKDATVAKACRLIEEAGTAGASLIAFPENFIPGHPSWFHFQPAGSAKSLASAVKLFGQAVHIPGPEVDELCAAAARAEITVVMGLTEKIPGSDGTLYNTQLFIDSTGSVIGKHQKLVATMTERMVHSPGRAETQRTFATPLGEVSSLVCGENSNPLALAMIAASYPLVHVASWPAHVSPSSGGGVRDISLLVSRSTAHMLGTFVVSSNGVNSEDMIADIVVTDDDVTFLRDANKNGGACIVNPAGHVIAGPMEGNQEGILYADVDFASCTRARLVLDVAGHYNRPDVYQLTVNNSPVNLVSTVSSAATAGFSRSTDFEQSTIDEESPAAPS